MGEGAGAFAFMYVMLSGCAGKGTLGEAMALLLRVLSHGVY